MRGFLLGLLVGLTAGVAIGLNLVYAQEPSA